MCLFCMLVMRIMEILIYLTSIKSSDGKNEVAVGMTVARIHILSINNEEQVHKGLKLPYCLAWLFIFSNGKKKEIFKSTKNST